MTKTTSEKPQPSTAQQVEQLLQQNTKEAYLRRLAKIGVIIKTKTDEPKL